MIEVRKRRGKRGASPRGQFEETKAVALTIIEERRAAERKKTEALRAVRLAKESRPSQRRPNDGLA